MAVAAETHRKGFIQGEVGSLRQRELRGRGRGLCRVGQTYLILGEYLLGSQGRGNFSHVEKIRATYLETR